MKKVIAILSILVTGFVSVVPLQGQGATKVASSIGQFLKIGVGARAAGMAESFSAVATDVTAIYWNPAGLSRIDRNQLFFSHINWLASISYDFFAIGIPLGNFGALGLFATSVQVPEDEVRTVLQPEGTGEFFEAGDLAIGFSYARNITDRFSVGFVGKLVQEKIWSMSSNSIALDIGTLYRSRWHDLTIGIVLNNFGTKAKLSGRANLLYVDPDPSIEGNIETIRAELEMQRWELPLNLKTSISMKIISSEALDLLAAVDMVHPNDNREYFNIGSELKVMDVLYLRGGFRGWGMDEAEGGLALGGGLRMQVSGTMSLQVDYALTDFGRLKNVHQFSFGIGF
ncbi:MAG: PorV/PorQ family protein [FCB group bacterium]|nr:PorV/PorQ family protein [FCB group bacterium]